MAIVLTLVMELENMTVRDGALANVFQLYLLTIVSMVIA